MNQFNQALVYNCKSESIPEQYNYFGGLIGAWDFEWNDCNNPRTVMGEWYFSWVLEGTAIQDVFICPSRSARTEHPQPDGEYGTTFRVYRPLTANWDIAYCSSGRLKRLEAIKSGAKIILTNLDKQTEKWVFQNITTDTFHWQNITVKNDNSWHINADLYARRSNESGQANHMVPRLKGRKYVKGFSD